MFNISIGLALSNNSVFCVVHRYSFVVSTIFILPGMNRIRGDIESDEGMDEHEVVGTFETLRDEGEHFLHVKQFERAIESFTKVSLLWLMFFFLVYI